MDDSGSLAGYLLVLGLVAWFSLPDTWTNAIWYAIQYKVGFNQVHTTNKPSDCDWTRAPLGNKGCHYKPVMTAHNASGELVGGDDAPRYSHDTKTGKPIISYDGGKAWWFSADVAPDLSVKAVNVRWTKVMD